MPYATEGTLTTDEREIAISETWDTQSDWTAYQSASGVVVNNGVVMLEQTNIPQSVIHRWPIQEGSGSTLTDTEGSADGSFVGGPTWTSDSSAIDGYLLSLDGTDDGVSTPATPPSGSMTMTCTIDFQNSISSLQRVCMFFSGGNGLRAINIGNAGTNTVGMNARNDAGGVTTATYQLPSTGRYRLVGVLDASAGELKIAVNGTVQSTVSHSGSFTTQATDHGLGYRPDTGDDYLNAAIDEPMVANEAWSNTQIQDDYNRQPWS